jgi:epoxyqueuosine reductase QueG
VVAFFIPFTAKVIKSNRGRGLASREWAMAYGDGNQLISEICESLHNRLEEIGVQCSWKQATHDFDEEKLVASWSHRHVAWACGLGQFGKNNLLITDAGCAGRLGSMVIDADIAPSPRLEDITCSHCLNSECMVCQKVCPVGALDPAGFNRHACYQQLLRVADAYEDLGLCDVCGKCSVGPCAMRRPGQGTGRRHGQSAD